MFTYNFWTFKRNLGDIPGDLIMAYKKQKIYYLIINFIILLSVIGLLIRRTIGWYFTLFTFYFFPVLLFLKKLVFDKLILLSNYRLPSQ